MSLLVPSAGGFAPQKGICVGSDFYGTVFAEITVLIASIKINKRYSVKRPIQGV